MSLRKRATNSSTSPSSISSHPSTSSNSSSNTVIVCDEQHHQHGGFSLFTSLWLLVPIRILAALYMPIPDCDEVFNYWEPTHLLMYGRGLQTWEYSPEYGLRSYLYVGFHWAMGSAIQVVLRALSLEEYLGGKLAIFYGIRIMLGIITAYCEAKLVRSVHGKFGYRVASFFLLFLAWSTGMFHCSIAYLPQSFTMCTLMLCFSCWMDSNFAWAIFWMGASSLIGWPFSVLTAIPLAFEILFRYRCSLHKPIGWGIVSALACIVPSMLVDFYFYRKWFMAVVNIALYNSSTAAGTKGATLYGVEPWTFYVKNLLLNFNCAFVLALLSPLFALLVIAYHKLCKSSSSVDGAAASKKNDNRKSNTNGNDGDEDASQSSLAMSFLKFSAPLWIWFALMMSMPHKEERFLFIIYPLFALSAAYSLATIVTWFQPCAPASAFSSPSPSPSPSSSSSSSSRLLSWWSWSVTILVFVVYASVSISRSTALIKNFGSPFQVYQEIYNIPEASTPSAAASTGTAEELSLCVGKEWYRFPSHFFLAERDEANGIRGMRLDFLKSDFDGLLPKYFETGASLLDSTTVMPTDMNDQNREEMSRYVDPASSSACHYVVDLDLPQHGPHEPHWHGHSIVSSLANEKDKSISSWQAVYASMFLDSGASPAADRAFYVPSRWESRNTFRPYQLLKKTHQTVPQEPEETTEKE